MMITARTRAVRHALPHFKSFSGRYVARRWQYNNSVVNNSLPHTTYFQTPPPPPPRRRILRTVLLSTFCFTLGAWLAFGYDVRVKLAALAEDDSAQLDALGAAAMAAVESLASTTGLPAELRTAQVVLSARSQSTCGERWFGHSAQLPSNTPCEDASLVAGMLTDPGPDADKHSPHDWQTWAIFDGHAGPRTAYTLVNCLIPYVMDHLKAARCFDRPHTPNDPLVHNAIRDGFRETDDALIHGAARQIENADGDRSSAVYVTSSVNSGSCALAAFFDPANSVLRVANTGDSRAVLGRWDAAAGRYVAQALSTDHTGFNPDEVARLEREHPGEDVVDPKTGRIFGIAISRAFGDARWKWPAEVTQRCHELLWGPAPRPNGVVKTPPYLTAEPEITEVRVNHTGPHPDFLIMASDGLWDNLSNDHAVTCVQQWLDKFRPDDIMTCPPRFQDLPAPSWSGPLDVISASQSSKSQPGRPRESDDTYWDPEEQTLRWHVRPEHFIVEDVHCGEHLIKNALGGNRRDLFNSIMAVPPPYSRNVRDDITVHVIFFGNYHDLEAAPTPGRLQ